MCLLGPTATSDAPCALRPPGPRGDMASLLLTPVTVPGPMRGGQAVGIAPVGCDLLSPLESTPAHRPPGLKFQGRRREGGSRGTRPAKRPVLQARGGSAGVVGGAMCLQARAARTPLAVGASAERGGPDAVGVSVAGSVGVARAGAAIGPPTKRRRIGPKATQAEGSSSLSLADLARLAARLGGLV